MDKVRAKKELGQHFLIDQQIAQRIVDSLPADIPTVIEVGPGMGVLTQFLVQRPQIDLTVIEIDSQSVAYLQKHFPSSLDGRIIEGDFLKHQFTVPTCVIGNFPYNISTQIFFHVLSNKESVPVVVGMLQKEVAARLAAPAGTRAGGVLGILLQAFYDVEYLFEVGADRFSPPPKVQSAVIRCTRNTTNDLGCDVTTFRRVVKGAFSQRRKTLKNSLYSAFPALAAAKADHPFFPRRAETLTIAEFSELTNFIEPYL